MTWQHVKVGDLVTQVRGVSYSSGDAVDEYKDGYVELLRANNIAAGNLIFEDVTFVPKSKVNERQYLKQNDILIAASSGSASVVGKAASFNINRSVTFGAFCKVLRPNENVDARYIANYFQTSIYRRTVSVLAEGANINNLRNEHIDNLDILLPPFAEQQRIAAILDKAAEIKAKHEVAIAKLDELAMSMFEVAVSSSQKIEALGELCDVRDGTHDSPKYVAEGFPLITSKNIVDGKIDTSTVNLINEEDYMEICKRSKVDHGDILMPMIGTIGNPVIVNELAPKFAIKNVALIKFKNNSPSNTYINAFLKSRHFYQYVNKLSRGGTQKFLGLGDIRKLPIPMLTKESEVEFCTRLQCTIMLREQAILKLAKVNSLASSLQHQAFTTGFSA